MEWILLVFMAGLTVFRATQNGANWLDIIGAASRLFNFWMGGNIKETFSSRTGKMVRKGESPVLIWNLCCLVLDCAFIGLEKNHCFASVRREK